MASRWEFRPVGVCVGTGTGESPIKIVPGDADKDSHMALSDPRVVGWGA